MNSVGAGGGETQLAEPETDVIEACQRWLELDFPNQLDDEATSTLPGLTEGELR